MLTYRQTIILFSLKWVILPFYVSWEREEFYTQFSADGLKLHFVSKRGDISKGFSGWVNGLGHSTKSSPLASVAIRDAPVSNSL